MVLVRVVPRPLHIFLGNLHHRVNLPAIYGRRARLGLGKRRQVEAIEIWEVLDEVIYVLIHLPAFAGSMLSQYEWTGAWNERRVAHAVVDAVQVLLGHDHVPPARESRNKSGARASENELHGMVVNGDYLAEIRPVNHQLFP